VQFYQRLGFRLCGLDTRLYDPSSEAGGETALFLAFDLQAPDGWDLDSDQRNLAAAGRRPLFAVRRARLSDFASIREMFRRLDEFHAAALPEINRVPEPSQVTESDLGEWIACDNCYVAVAERGRRLLGFIDASVHAPADPTEVDRPWLGINNLFVATDARRAGIGDALMDGAELWARAKGFVDARLDVYEFNQGARALYRRRGYETLSRRLHKSLAQSMGGAAS
jgi:ribosomal-protein-alanine N-acetyltransferase